MTALSGDARERLAAALNDLTVDNPMWIGDDGEPLEYLPEREALIANFLNDAADALLPVVAELADQRAAEELRAAAEEQEQEALRVRPGFGTHQGGHECAAEILRDRSRALTTPTSEGATR